MANTGAQRVIAERVVVQMVVMRIVTRFTTADQFIAAFHGFCTATTCFIPTTDGRAIGTDSGFSIRLADGTPMLRGMCIVEDAWSTAANPYGRPGVLLAIQKLSAESIPVFHQLQMMRQAVPQAVPQDDTAPHEPPPEALEKATIQMPSLFPDAECATFDDDDGAAVPSAAIVDGSSSQPTRWTWQQNPARVQIATLLGFQPALQRPAPPVLSSEVIVPPPSAPLAIVARPRWWTSLWSRLVAWCRPRRARRPRHARAQIRPLRVR